MEPRKIEQEQLPKAKKQPRPVSEARKIRKPLMERKRRERINVSLSELARLLTEANKVKTEPGKASKLEKADILELTVSHLQNIQNVKPNMEAEGAETYSEERYSEGFRECIKMVEKVLRKSTTDAIREKLLNHLHIRLKTLQCSRKVRSDGNRHPLQPKEDNKNSLTDSNTENALPEGNEFQKRNCSLTLVPTELPDGGVAFILKGDSERILKEWGHLSVEAKFRDSSINENKTYSRNSEDRLAFPEESPSSSDSKILTQVPSHQTKEFFSHDPSVTTEHECINQISYSNPNSSSELETILDISTANPSLKRQNISSYSNDRYLCSDLSHSSMPTDLHNEYSRFHPSISPVSSENENSYSPTAQCTTQCLPTAFHSESNALVISYNNTTTPSSRNEEISSGLIFSGSHASINFSDEFDNNSPSAHQAANRVSHINCCPSTSRYSYHRLSNKAHCPPTPPPSPPSAAENRKSTKESLNVIEDGLMHREDDLDQPFDLSISKMWRPW